MEITQQEADRLVRLRARFRTYGEAEVRALLSRAFPLESRPDIAALEQAEAFFVYLELRARWGEALQLRDCVRPLESVVRSWFQSRDALQ